MSPGKLLSHDEDVVESTLNFWLDPAKGGHSSYFTGTAGYYRRKFDEHTVPISNLRGREDEFSLSDQGFQHYKHTSIEKTFDDEDRIKTIVYPETEQLLKDVTGATSVHTFSHVVRRSSREKVQAAVNSEERYQDDSVVIPDVTPARFIHIDFSNDGAQQILEDNFAKEGANTNKGRWAIINVWRAIKPVAKDPLTLCDATTALDEDLMPVTANLPPKGSGQYADNVSKGDSFELYYLRYNEGQKWYYFDTMRPDEVILLKCFDSTQDGKIAKRVPHTAFTNPKTAEDANRESIEVRCFVFWED